MRKAERIQQLVRAIQEYVVQEELSPADLFRIVTERGADVSESTVRRIAKAEPGKENFNIDVLQRVSTALFRVNDSPLPADEIDSPELAEREALRAVTALTDAALKEAQTRIAQLEEKLSLAETRNAELVDLVSFLKQQLTEKDRQMEKLWQLIKL